MSALQAKTWPFEQARALLKHVVTKRVPANEIREALPLAAQADVRGLIDRWPDMGRVVTFETGYGPSGAPHIGTFGEVVRTSMVRRAFVELTGGLIPTRLLAFSDDYDAFRRVPDGLPESMKEDIGRPLTRMNDPYGEFESFAERNNTALRVFLDHLGVDYTFISSTDAYTGVDGVFDEGLKRVYDNYQGVLDIILPTLGGQGGDRASTYSPFMPRSDYNGKLVEDANVRLNGAYTILFDDRENDHPDFPTSIFDGYVKLQWKVDWGMRWFAFDVDYEMHGKDLIDSAVLSSRICKLLGGTPPLTYFYELFLDEEGKKISKSKGNGMSIEDWLTYGTEDGLALLMFQNPRAAKELHLRVVPRMEDEYLKNLAAYQKAPSLDNPVWHLHAGNVPTFGSDVSYGLLTNLASATGDADEATVLGFLSQYRSIREEDRARIEALVPKVVAYVAKLEEKEPRQRRAPTEQETAAFNALADKLATMDDGLDGEAYQFEVYEVGKAFGFDPLRAWFQGLYEVLFGDSQGPRFGTFISAYGRERTIGLLRRATHG